jgi:hypothetical protein
MGSPGSEKSTVPENITFLESLPIPFYEVGLLLIKIVKLKLIIRNQLKCKTPFYGKIYMPC